MPIKGLTERPNIPRLGKIRLGEKNPTNGAPINRPYFVVPEEVATVYGDKPTELRVVFLTDELDRIASQYYRAYNATSGLICRGDGEDADALLDGDVLAANGGSLEIDAWAHGRTGGRSATTKYVRQQIHCAGSGLGDEAPCPMFAAKKCAVRSFMQFAIRDVPGLGVYQLDTGSVINIRNINGTIELARAMFGGVARVPMLLRRSQLEVSPDGVKKKVWGCELLVDTQYSLANLIEIRSDPRPLALLPPVDETEVYDGAFEDEEVEAPALPAAAPTPITDEQRRRYSAAVRQAAATWPADEYKAFADSLIRDYPHAFQAIGAPNLKALTGEQAETIIAALEHGAAGEGAPVGAPERTPAESASPNSAPPRAPNPECEHEASFDEDSTLMRCSKCGLVLEEPQVTGQEQPALPVN